MFRWLLRRAPKGDGHPVLVIPGFMADDDSTKILRAFLNSLGYATYGWGLGINYGPSTLDLDKEFKDMVRQIEREHKSDISVVGQSLGGVYAREIAKDHPDRIRQVVTLGSPLRGQGGSAEHVESLYHSISGTTPNDMRASYADIRGNPPVPSTSIYSEYDGIVSWRNSLQDDHHEAENVAVYSSHIGMAVNPTVLYVVADRLAQLDGEWSPFKASWDLIGLFPYLKRKTV